MNTDITKILLINPPSPFLISDTVMPPLGLMYLSSNIKKNIKNVNVEIIDLATNKDISIPLDCDIYAFTSTTPQYNVTLDIMKKLKSKNNKATFVIGGAHASCFSEKCRTDGFDCVIVGEGEKSISYICNFIIEHKKDNSLIRGIIKSHQIENIDNIQFPDRTFDGYDKYKYYLDGKKCATMITSRGCPFKCNFCCNMWGNNVRLRSSENILQEVEQIQKSGVSAIQFYDDTFTINKKRVVSICKGLKEMNITWRCFVHTNTVNFELLKTMKDSGCVEIGIGVESGNKQILNIVNKNIDIDKVTEICNICHRIGLRIKTFLIIGLPGESHTSVQDTINFLKKAVPDDYDYSIYTPFPRTDIWDNVNSYDIKFDKEKLDYSKMYYKGISGKYQSQVSTSNLPIEEIENLREYVDNNIRNELYDKKCR